MAITEQTAFQKKDYRPWTIDILENSLDVLESERPSEDYFLEDAASPLKPLFADVLQIHHTANALDPRPILIGNFLDTSLLCLPPSSNIRTRSSPIDSTHYTGAIMQAKEEIALLQTRIAQLEQVLSTEKELRALLEEKYGIVK